MDWFKKHVDAIMIISSIIISMIWMNGQFNAVEKRFAEVDKDLAVIRTEMAVIKTVLLMKNILPSELCKNSEEKK
jgi:hypothetical protein